MINAKISVFVVFVEAIINLLLYNLHDCTFKSVVSLLMEDIFDYHVLCFEGMNETSLKARIKSAFTIF